MSRMPRSLLAVLACALGTCVAAAQTPSANQMFFRYTGYIRVPRAGVYTFLARSDDSAALWIGDQNVFWSLGQSPKTTETWAQAALQAGFHPITVGYFQAYGLMQLQMYIEGPGLARQRIPSSMLFRDAAGR